MVVLNLTNLLALLGFIALVISNIKFTRNNEKQYDISGKKSVLKTLLTLGVGIAILIVTISKNEKDRRSSSLNEQRADSVRILLNNLRNTTAVLNRKIDTIQTLTQYLKRLDSIGIKRDAEKNQPVITKIFTNYIKEVGTLIQQ